MASLVHLSLSDTAKSSEFVGVSFYYEWTKNHSRLSLANFPSCYIAQTCIICPFLKSLWLRNGITMIGSKMHLAFVARQITQTKSRFF